MRRDIQGYEIIDKDRLSHWSILLEEWLILIKRYCRFMKNDAPYFYNERANIGILAAAAWRAGWIALEEFEINKSSQERGRCDLWFWPINQEKEEYIEAKIEWRIQKIEDALEQALKEVEKIDFGRESDVVRIGVVFICPEINKEHKSAIDKIIQKLIEDVTISKRNKLDIIAWSFPYESRQLARDKWFYPGILLGAKVLS